MLLFFYLIIGHSHLWASPVFDKAIYGDDNRRAIKESSPLEIKWGKAVLAEVPTYKIRQIDSKTISFDTITPIAALNLCPEEKFSSESMLASCSGFLVAPDLLVTAGHCMKDLNDCKNNLWLLDFDESQNTFTTEQIYACKDIVAANLSSDFTLIRLSRPVKDRRPLTIRQKGSLNKNAEFTVIGHPLGLPKIASDQAFLHGNLGNKTFTIFSDTYSGNSGSPVIDVKTSLVEGILIKGDRDFQMDYDSGCYRSYHCDSDNCLGETVLRSIYIPLASALPVLH